MTTMLETEPMPSGPDAPKSPTQGASSPLGATPRGDGVNFSVFSKYATGVPSTRPGSSCCFSTASTTCRRRA
jgi:hypothetical protein